MEIEGDDGEGVTEGEVHENGAVYFGGEMPEEAGEVFGGGAIGKLAEDDGGAAGENAILFEHGEIAVELVDRFVEIFEDEDAAGCVREIGSSAEGGGDGEVADQGQAGCGAALQFGDGAIFGGGFDFVRLRQKGAEVIFCGIGGGDTFGEFAEHGAGDGAACAEFLHGPVEGGDVAVSGERQFRASLEGFPVEQREEMGGTEAAANGEEQIDFWVQPEPGEVGGPVFGVGGEVGNRGGAVDVGSEFQFLSGGAEKGGAGVERFRAEFSGRGDDSDGGKRRIQCVHARFLPPSRCRNARGV